MSILVSKNTRLLVQGITGKEGSYHAQRSSEYGANLVAGVTPGKGGTQVEGFDVFDSVSEAKDKTDANTSLIFVPAAFAPDAILEAVDAGIKFKSHSGLMVETTGVSLTVDSHDITVHEVSILEGVGEGNTYYYNLDTAELIEE